MARSERQEDGARVGVGTMARPGGTGNRRGSRPPAGQPPEPAVPATILPATGLPATGLPAATPRRTRPAGQAGSRAAAPAPAGRRPVAPPRRLPPAERATGPQPVLPKAPGTQGPGTQGPGTHGPGTHGPGTHGPGTQAHARGHRAQLAATRRMPFVLLLCGLLGGALVSALVISTTLAAGSFQITKLQNASTALTRQRQVLEAAVARAQSAQVIAERASKLGMRRPQQLLFLDLKTGKTADDGPTWSGADNAPGYAP